MTPAKIYALARRAGLSVRAAVTATAIALAESGGRPRAVGDESLTDSTWGPSIGLWQVRSVRDQTGTGQDRDATRLRDPGFNAHAMYDISGGGKSWGAWSVYNSGAYRDHLDEAAAAARGAGHRVQVDVDQIAAAAAANGTVLPMGWTDDLGQALGAAGDVAGGIIDKATPWDEFGDLAGDAAGAVGGKIGGAVGGAVADKARPLVLTAVVLAGGLALVIAGAAATVRPIQRDLMGEAA